MRNPTILIGTLLVAIAVSGQRQASPSDAPLVLTNANVVNVRDGAVIPGATIVLRNGGIVEQGESRALFENPKTDYTRELVDAIPHIEIESAFAAAGL